MLYWDRGVLASTRIEEVLNSNAAVEILKIEDTEDQVLLCGKYVGIHFVAIIRNNRTDIEGSGSDFYDLCKDLTEFGPVYLNGTLTFNLKEAVSSNLDVVLAGYSDEIKAILAQELLILDKIHRSNRELTHAMIHARTGGDIGRAELTKVEYYENQVKAYTDKAVELRLEVFAIQDKVSVLEDSIID